MRTLVIGATGTVGSRVVSGLIEKGRSVRGMTRSPEKAKGFPQGVEPVIADMEKPESLTIPFAGVDAVFLLAPVSPTETQLGLAAVEAAKKARARKIVYMSVALPPGSEHIPHFASKIPVERAVQASGLQWTILRPNNFFQNDYWSREAITRYGVYPQPIGPAGTNRIDVRDIADAVVNALLNPGHAGEIYSLNGADALTGTDVAETWSRHLGREVRYGGDDLDAWEKEAVKMLPAWMVRDFRIMYEFFQKRGFKATPEEMSHAATAVGHAPRPFDDFVAETARDWKRG
jgi:uncharacterized protein YbjT (DUF2867 family)